MIARVPGYPLWLLISLPTMGGTLALTWLLTLRLQLQWMLEAGTPLR